MHSFLAFLFGNATRACLTIGTALLLIFGATFIGTFFNHGMDREFRPDFNMWVRNGTCHYVGGRCAQRCVCDSGSTSCNSDCVFQHIVFDSYVTVFFLSTEVNYTKEVQVAAGDLSAPACQLRIMPLVGMNATCYLSRPGLDTTTTDPKARVIAIDNPYCHDKAYYEAQWHDAVNGSWVLASLAGVGFIGAAVSGVILLVRLGRRRCRH
jgi:hypothetical protein